MALIDGATIGVTSVFCGSLEEVSPPVRHALPPSTCVLTNLHKARCTGRWQYNLNSYSASSKAQQAASINPSSGLRFAMLASSRLTVLI